MHEFDSKDLKRLFGIPASQVRSLIKAGHINPLKKAGRLSYSFQDLIVLRTLGSLRAAKIPTQKINRTLREIRESLPGELPLSGLSIVAVGDRIVVREGQSLRESDTGQYTLALDFIDQGGDLLMIDRRTDAGSSAAEENAATGAMEDNFERALALEHPLLAWSSAIDVRREHRSWLGCHLGQMKPASRAARTIRATLRIGFGGAEAELPLAVL